MSNTVKLYEHNETFCKVQAPTHIELELQDRFSFEIPNAKFNPKVKAGTWDGKIKLLNRREKTIYKGLEEKIRDFCEENEYGFESELSSKGYPISKDELNEFLDSITSKDSGLERRDYQVEAIQHAIQNKRGTYIAATSSGKSYIIYSLIRFWDKPTLLIVPRVGLVGQMKSDFKTYAPSDWDVDEMVTGIYADGDDKTNLKQIVVSTWQSIIKYVKENPSWFEQFEVIIGDECHEFKATSLKDIMECSKLCEYRYGFTGTLDGVEVNELVVEGLFGPIIKVIRAHELIELGFAPPLKIKCFQFEYSKATCKVKRDYNEEISFINTHAQRLKFTVKLALALKKNVLVLFRKVDEHGEVLKLLAESLNKDGEADIHFISGRISAKVREEIRKKMESRERPQILFASEGTSAVGTSIKNIDYIIFASPSKARIRVLQSIGRGLRMSKTKTEITVFDLSDDLTRGKKRNYTYNHFLERLKMYVSEQFPYSIKKIKLEN